MTLPIEEACVYVRELHNESLEKQNNQQQSNML